MENMNSVTGGCLCGAVRYSISKPLYDAHYCHCRTCQKASGAPVIAGAFLPRDAIIITSGQPKFFQSSPIVSRGFCSDCGTYLLYQPLITEWSNWTIVTIASLDSPELHPPKIHYGVEGRIPWFETNDNLPRESYDEDFVEILSDNSHEGREAILRRFGAD